MFFVGLRAHRHGLSRSEEKGMELGLEFWMSFSGSNMVSWGSIDQLCSIRKRNRFCH